MWLCAVDLTAVSITAWLSLSAFYGQQPLSGGGVNVWFAFCDATGVMVGSAILYILVPALEGRNWLWLLLIPTVSYGAVLGGTTAPVSLALNSDWPVLMRWVAGFGTIALCVRVVYGCSLMVLTRSVADNVEGVGGAGGDGVSTDARRTDLSPNVAPQKHTGV